MDRLLPTRAIRRVAAVKTWPKATAERDIRYTVDGQPCDIIG
jgi:hypothetical protein